MVEFQRFYGYVLCSLFYGAFVFSAKLNEPPTLDLLVNREGQIAFRENEDESLRNLLPEHAFDEPVVRVSRATQTVFGIRLDKNSSRIAEGDSITVTCTGNTSDIAWTDPANKKVKSNSDRVSVGSKSQNTPFTLELKLKKVESKHAGIYKCVDAGAAQGMSANFTLSVYPKPSAVILPSKQVTIEEGDDVEINCKGNSHNVSWQNPNGYQLPVYADGRNALYAAVRGNESLLTFKNATKWQAGNYLCIVNTSGLENRAELSVTVESPKLRFMPNKDSIAIKENKDEDVTCEGTVNTLAWTYNGKEISTNKKDDIYQKHIDVNGRKLSRKLKFEDVQKTNEGDYVCVGYSSFNNTKMVRTLRLRVLEDSTLSQPKLSSPNSSAPVNTLTLLANESFQIDCKGDTENIEWLGPPHFWKIPEDATPTHTEWVKKKKLGLMLRSVTAREEGTYKCRVTKRDVHVENQFDLKVVVPTHINDSNVFSHPTAREGNQIKLDCIVGGYPKPTVNWYFNKKLITETDSFKFDGDNLIILNVNYTHAGKYVCKASQMVDRGVTAEKAISLQVLHKPYFEQDNITVERLPGATGYLKCECSANPAAVYTWYKDDTIYVALNGLPAHNLIYDTIEITLASENGFGNYTCNATNTYGFSSQRITVIKMLPPLPPQIEILQKSSHNVSFDLKAERNATITHFNIEYRESTGSEWSDKNETKYLFGVNYKLDDLKMDTEYILRARSINPVGYSDFSPETKFRTSAIPNSAVKLADHRLLAVLISVIIVINTFRLNVR